LLNGALQLIMDSLRYWVLDMHCVAAQKKN